MLNQRPFFGLGFDVEYGDFSCAVVGQVVGIFELHFHHLILLRNNGVDQRNQQIFILFAAQKLFKRKINAGIYFAHRL